MAPDGPVFISYSRRDYYFAESLALELMQQGVTVWLDVKDLEPGAVWEHDLEDALDRASGVVLVASPDSMRTMNVRKEWERARGRGTRIVIACFRRTRLPAELTDCDVVDFRGAFGPALRELVACLSPALPGAPPDARRRLHTGPRLPLSILALLLALAVPTAGYFLLANWTLDANESALLNVVTMAFMPLGAVALLWFFCVSLLSRRMGMTRLAACLTTLAAVYVLPLVLSWLGGSLAGYAPQMAQFASRRAHVLGLLAATPLAGLLLVLVIRPADLLRWTPTGRAWEWYRATCAAGADVGFDIPDALKNVRGFRLQCDLVDQPAADRLGAELRAMGARETPGGGDESTAILLLTDRTRLEWLTQEVGQLASNVRVVVGARIRLPEQLGPLWRHQWIDFRHWDVARLARQRLPQIPEAVTGVRFPLPVRGVHHLICSLIGLLLYAVGLATPEGQDPGPLDGSLAMACWIALAWLARRLLRRRIKEASFVRWWTILATLASAVVIWDLGRVAIRDAAWLSMIPAALFLLVIPVASVRLRPRLAFWFPAPDSPRTKPAETLSAGRDWQTLLWTSVHLLAWGLLFSAVRS